MARKLRSDITRRAVLFVAKYFDFRWGGGGEGGDFCACGGGG